MSRPGALVLGSQAIHTPQTPPKLVQVTQQTCFNLSLFKDLLREYRKLDDTVTMRLNRSAAQFRDRDRLGLRSSESNPQDEACLHLWKELVENWKGRTQMIDYCVNVVDGVLQERQKGIERTEVALDAERGLRAKLYSDEVLRNQIHNELTVEKIIRQRSVDAFKSRCKFFDPPQSDAESRQWWNNSTRGP